VNGVATTPSPPTTSSPIYTFTSKTAPTTIKLRAVETTPGGDGVSSSGFTEGTTTVRSGRARLLNAYGSELLDLPMAFRTEFWNGTGWTLNSADVCTGDASLGAANAVSLTLSSGLTCVWDALPAPGLSNAGCATAAPAGRKYLEGATPTIGFAGDFNLWLKKPGTAGTVTVTPTVPAWLGAVPAARATFGIYKTPIIYMRENY
jgi:MSHA biogenesis protein MshQ